MGFHPLWWCGWWCDSLYTCSRRHLSLVRIVLRSHNGCCWDISIHSTVLFLKYGVVLHLPWVTVGMGVGIEHSYHLWAICSFVIETYSVFRTTVQHTGYISRKLEAVVQIHLATLQSQVLPEHSMEHEPWIPTSKGGGLCDTAPSYQLCQCLWCEQHLIPHPHLHHYLAAAHWGSWLGLPFPCEVMVHEPAISIPLLFNGRCCVVHYHD